MIETTKTPKPKRKSKTLGGILAAAGGLLLVATGISTPEDVAFLADGFQVSEDLGPALVLVGTVVAGIGIRMADRPLK